VRCPPDLAARPRGAAAATMLRRAFTGEHMAPPPAVPDRARRAFHRRLITQAVTSHPAANTADADPRPTRRPCGALTACAAPPLGAARPVVTQQPVSTPVALLPRRAPDRCAALLRTWRSVAARSAGWSPLPPGRPGSA